MKELCQTIGSIRLAASLLLKQIAKLDKELAAFGGKMVGEEGEIHPNDISYAKDWFVQQYEDLQNDLRRF